MSRSDDSDLDQPLEEDIRRRRRSAPAGPIGMGIYLLAIILGTSAGFILIVFMPFVLPYYPLALIISVACLVLSCALFGQRRAPTGSGAAALVLSIILTVSIIAAAIVQVQRMKALFNPKVEQIAPMPVSFFVGLAHAVLTPSTVSPVKTG